MGNMLSTVLTGANAYRAQYLPDNACRREYAGGPKRRFPEPVPDFGKHAPGPHGVIR